MDGTEPGDTARAPRIVRPVRWLPAGHRAGHTVRLLLTAAVIYVLANVATALAFMPDITRLQRRNPPTTALMRERIEQARRHRRPTSFTRIFVPYDRISPFLKGAVLVAEDSSFFSHHGIDYRDIPSCLAQDIRQRRWAEGCSTITQQLAKNLYLTTNKNITRKVRDMLIALELEHRLTKQRILELYLNYIEWGKGIYGCEAAARAYFHTSAARLTPEQAIRLASIIMDPRNIGPFTDTPEMTRYRKAIARYMHDAGYLNDHQYRSLPF